MKIEEINGEKYYKIERFNEMRPFFMSIVSDSNHWLFIASNGALTAGRKNAENALFPYYTDDKIIHSWDTTGSKSIFRIHGTLSDFVWEPFSHRFNEKYKFQRNLYKSIYGNSIIFEEILFDLNIAFRYKWASSDMYGFVKTSEIQNLSDRTYNLTVLDGFQNIMPYGVPSDLQTSTSNLVDAYKRNELNEETGMGIFSLSAIIVDKAEPSEALKCNIAWSIGLDSPNYLLSSRQLNSFRYKGEIEQEYDIKGERGAYFVVQKMTISKNENKKWHILADVNKDYTQVIEAIETIKASSELIIKIDNNISLGTEKLKKLIASADGIQYSADDRKNNRHFSNVLFNVMRGGIFDNNYFIEKEDFLSYFKNANVAVFQKFQSFFQNLPNTFLYYELLNLSNSQGDPDLIRLSIEYLPLKFSRRHGDPSRPWNKFSINTKNDDGSKVLDYEGNWRDIFQNWEALAYSYPRFIEGMIFKFLNATTFDGYNPYRVTKGGFDWETIEPHNPWSNIGYWGDHQIIYLLKFLEFIEQTNPGKLIEYFDKEYFVYAAVPYRIKPYQELLKNSRVTIDYDYEWEEKISTRCEQIGADGRLVKDNSDGIHRVNLIEKLLATSLSKMSNFVPGGGIWLNTQRPEWNDANNALVGNGLSMVTLYYLRRFFKFFGGILEKSNLEQIKISNELVDFYHGIREGLLRHQAMLARDFTNEDRKIILDTLGQVASDYRMHIYTYGFWGKKRTHSMQGLKNYVNICLAFIEKSIAQNERKDKLFHAYNLMTYTSKGIEIAHLSEMLEGQVAVLSSGYLDSEKSLNLINALRQSKLYRSDAKSYILYPNKELPKFLERNVITPKQVKNFELVDKLISDGDTSIISKDLKGNFHFNGKFNNAEALLAGLNELAKLSEYSDLVSKDTPKMLDLYEEIFDHKSFTGRSGTFFAYEGLGSIYWHMVSKLYLSIAENLEKIDDKDTNVKEAMTMHFLHTGQGIGLYKSANEYGAFPTDPYSHTPLHRGAQQPGMTGQVKEDIITRFKELGIILGEGKLQFAPKFLQKSEFFEEENTLIFYDLNGSEISIDVPKNSLAFTICQVPIIYIQSNKSKVTIHFDNHIVEIEGNEINAEQTANNFDRSGEILKIEVELKN
ncbi:MAG: hypothetical protein MUE53_02145 [Chitinophagales bacterium]|nr:hypothetical protein [Chitinophagales bacterium]